MLTLPKIYHKNLTIYWLENRFRMSPELPIYNSCVFIGIFAINISTILMVRKACPSFYINWWRSGNPNSSKIKQGIRLRCFIA